MVPPMSADHEEAAQAAVARCAALNEAAARRPLDAPPPEDGPAFEVVELARMALQTFVDAQQRTRAYLWINLANALRALGPEHDEAAAGAYAKAIAIVPDNGAWHFDLAVLHKWCGRWRSCFDQSLRARARLGQERAVLWNLALAATALGDGDVAGGVWRELGMEVELNAQSGLPMLRKEMPPFQVRAPSHPTGYGLRERVEETFEVLWVRPLSPCHGIVQSPSFRKTPIDYGDVVLWDGAPVATSDAEAPCFPLLEILRRGQEVRLHFIAIVRPGDVEAIVARLQETRAFVHPEGNEVDGAHLVYGKFVLTPNSDLAALRSALEEAVANASIRIAVPELYERMVGGKRAGREHREWRTIERSAIKRGMINK